jgi:hypothetical protein
LQTYSRVERVVERELYKRAPGGLVSYDPVNNLTVITNAQSNSVVTTVFGQIVQ